MSEQLLNIEDLRVRYPGRWRSPGVLAVDGVSLEVGAGESVGLVGESGSGKTSLGSAVLGLAPATGGRILFDGEDITHASPARRRSLSAEIQVIFQDPYSSLNPLRTVGQTLAEPLLVHKVAPRSEVPGRIVEMLERVGLDGSAAALYPTQFSGGQRQRIAIARALTVSPRLVICDEAVSALDLSVQAQVLNLLLDLQEQMSLSYLFISHDMDVVRHMTERLAVLYRGEIVEFGTTEQTTREPHHPYTRALLAAVPLPHPQEQARRRRIRQDERPALPDGTAGDGSCRYVDRCAFAIPLCGREAPVLEPVTGGGVAACHRRDALPQASESGTEGGGGSASRSDKLVVPPTRHIAPLTSSPRGTRQRI